MNAMNAVLNEEKSQSIDKMNPKTSITPYQQMISSCTGALVTSFFGINHF